MSVPRWRSLDGRSVPMPLWDECVAAHALHAAKAQAAGKVPLSEWEFVLTLLVEGVRAYRARAARQEAAGRLIKTPDEVREASRMERR